MELKEIDKLIRETPFEMMEAMPYLQHVSPACMQDITGGWANYYKYLAKMMRALKPKKVIELGSAAGTADLMMLSTLPKDSMLYAMTIPEPEGEFRFIQEDYPNLTMIRGNSTHINDWNNVDISDTDIWFFDTDHQYALIHAELELYDLYFKDGALVLIDDIHLNSGMDRAWNEIKYPKIDLSDLHTYKDTGFGLFQVCKS